MSLKKRQTFSDSVSPKALKRWEGWCDKEISQTLQISWRFIKFSRVWYFKSQVKVTLFTFNNIFSFKWVLESISICRKWFRRISKPKKTTIIAGNRMRPCNCQRCYNYICSCYKSQKKYPESTSICRLPLATIIECMMLGTVPGSSNLINKTPDRLSKSNLDKGKLDITFSKVKQTLTSLFFSLYIVPKQTFWITFITNVKSPLISYSYRCFLADLQKNYHCMPCVPMFYLDLLLW